MKIQELIVPKFELDVHGLLKSIELPFFATVINVRPYSAGYIVAYTDPEHGTATRRFDILALTRKQRIPADASYLGMMQGFYIWVRVV